MFDVGTLKKELEKYDDDMFVALDMPTYEKNWDEE